MSQQAGCLAAGTCSSRLVPTQVPVSIEPRTWWIENSAQCPPPWISRSSFIGSEMVEHLMRHKRQTALGVKSAARLLKDQDKISNMEGLLHTFVIPLVVAYMHGDYHYGQGHQIQAYTADGTHQPARQVIISALIHPDFENEQVMWRFCSLERPPHVFESALFQTKMLAEGTCYNETLATREQIQPFSKSLDDWDQYIKSFILKQICQIEDLREWYNETKHTEPMSPWAAIKYLKAIMTLGAHAPRDAFKYKTMQIQSSSGKQGTLSLEVLFAVLLEQVKNEFNALEHICRHTGYIYTFDPPVIFRQALGSPGRELMLLMHAAALRQFASTRKLHALKVFAYNDFDSPEACNMIRLAFQSQDVAVTSKSNLFAGRGPMYSPHEVVEKTMLVIHNNSDAFGQNIEFEHGNGSLDAVVGQYSSAAASLLRERPDLISPNISLVWRPAAERPPG